ncbi:substrate-binding domain-containing protein [Treponema sp.]|uniref:substrate-binding domain-containing protein n=1 Tax=Treponema sp. TaxID=166 RepID=UPI0025EAB5AB|nr:substrate-binding domain-containing protein [Treponema sp.]MBR4323174.1 substrate-binding domain-containing protein [Treponema sp.]
MNSGLSKRKAFLQSQKNQGHRITFGFAGIADFRSFIGQEYIAGMLKAASDYDLNFINFAGAIKYSFFDDIDFIARYFKTFRFMKKPLIDGLVTWTSSFCELTDVKRVEDTFNSIKPLPMVDIGYLDLPGIPSVRIDNEYSISILMKHLVIDHKYRKFAFIGSETSSPHLERLKCYGQELQKYGIQELENSVFLLKEMNSADIAAAVNKMLSCHDIRDKKEIHCIVTPSDLIASSVIEELDKHGISVPRDVAVTGFNNQYSGVFARSPVTTMNLEYFKRGYAAVELLIDRIMAPREHFDTLLVPTSLLIRQSCGCFEQSILEAAEAISNSEEPAFSLSTKEDFRPFILEKLRQIFPNLNENKLLTLADSIFDDIQGQKKESEILRYFQSLLQDLRKEGLFVNSEVQQKLTLLRKTILSFLPDLQKNQMENIFHQLRILASVFIEYDTIAPREDSYLMNTLSQIAINFASAKSGRQIQDVLRYQLGEMGIPGIILSLSENMTSDLGSTSLELILPEPPADIQKKLPFKITDPAFIPKFFFPQGRRYSFMVEILHHEDKYFGFAFLEIGNPNISIYDTVRTLLSNALNTVYLREGRSKKRTMLLTGEELKGILNLSEDDSSEVHNGLKASEITGYLLEHLSEMTDLDKMARELSVSKSHLVRRAKELTGYTIQTMHEKLKIEQAKKLLQVDSLKLGEIASRLGFQNQNYFSSVFKKNTGMSPRAWAKRYLH